MNIIAPFQHCKNVSRNSRKRFYDYGSKETLLMRNWRLYWRSYQKSREKAPFGALVLFGF